jgi:glycosyltransferase involved in cell wall biosynthesis
MPTVAIIHNHPIHYKHLLFCEMSRLGLDFHVLFTAACSGARLEAPLPKSGEYGYSIGWPGSYESAPAPGSALSVWRTLSKLQPQVVIISGWCDAAAWTAWLWAQRHNARIILWAESNEFDQPRTAWKELPKKLFVSRCEQAHVYGTSNRDYLCQLGMAPRQIVSKRAVVDTERFLAEVDVPKPDHKTLLYVGRFSPEKNLTGLLQAFRGVRQDPSHPRIVLDLVGYGPLESDLRALTSALGLDPFVRFRGKFQQAELALVYSSADAFVLPSVSETWGLVVNEAMLCGLPVLVSTQCGCAADLAQSETGWTFSPYVTDELTRLLELIAETPRAELERKGSLARQLAAQYNPKDCAATVADMVHRLIANDTNGRVLHPTRSES